MYPAIPQIDRMGHYVANACSMDTDMPDKDFHLHNSFAFWVSRLAQQMQEQFNRDLKDHDISWHQWALLNVMQQGVAKTPAQAADAIGADRSTVTRMLDRLEKRGLAMREHDGLDRRVVKISLTKEALTLMSALNQLAQAHQAQFLSELPSTEYRSLRGSLVKMLRAGGVDAINLWQRVN